MSSISPTIAFNKDAFPNQPAYTAGRTKSFSLPKPAQSSCVTASRDGCCVSLQAQYQAFVRFAVESSTAPAIALNWTCVLEPFTRRALVSRTLASTRIIPTGPATLDRCCGAERSRSRGIFQVVFLRSNRTLSGHFAACDGPRNARQIGFGRGSRALTPPPPSKPRSGRFGPPGLHDQGGARAPEAKPPGGSARGRRQARRRRHRARPADRDSRTSAARPAISAERI